MSLQQKIGLALAFLGMASSCLVSFLADLGLMRLSAFELVRGRTDG
ncbi:MAG: hypothetical protein HYW07_17215 [Candidatus Latescibacteria bacterium]|nr:hypothetical protein [Candidatus Latescibacterota bacterium]